MSRDESLATLIQETLRETLERRSEDPGAVDRVGVAVGAVLGHRVAVLGHRVSEDEDGAWDAAREPASRAHSNSDPETDDKPGA
jgi:hypothetical protein